MLSKRTKYALKAMIALADKQQQGPMLISALAAQEAIPKKFLEQILLDLRNAGFVKSKKGKGGGYELRRAPEQIMLGQIVRMFDGPLAPLPCVSRTAYRPCTECLDERTCGLRLVMKEVRDVTAKILDNTSLADVQKKVALAQATVGRLVSYEI